MTGTYPAIPSGSTNGRPVLVVATATLGTTLHTAVSGTANMDEIYVWAFNDDTVDRLLTIEFGGAVTPGDTIRYTVPFNDGLHLIIPGIRLQNGLVVTAFAAAASVITCVVNVNRLIRVDGV